jgi:hypothetical protein
MKEEFKSTNFRSDSLVLINHCNSIVEDYLSQGLKLTLRQLYYQLVTKNIIKNEERAYKNLSNIVSDGRLSGLIDWSAIEDRIRIPAIPSEWENLKDLVDAALYSYRLPRWSGQENYIELWVEKDALAGVLHPLARKYHITMMVNRGYSSQSAMYEASKRIIEKGLNRTECRILYLGDFDPSGEDMVRDIRDRMLMFGVNVDVNFDIHKIALTLDQVKKYNPPPNPTKRTDPRSRDFIQKYGASSWEVDAINPSELQKIITSEILAYLDIDGMNIIVDKENRDKERLSKAVEKIMRGEK